MKVTTSAQMHAIDAQASGPDWGVPSLALMESAGAALARACVEELGGSAGNKKIAIACGKRQQWRRRVCRGPAFGGHGRAGHDFFGGFA